MSRLSKIESRVKAATPGPWSAQQIRDEDPNPLHHSWGEGCWYVAAPCGDVNVCDVNEGRNPEADAALIAHAPADLAWAVDQIALLRGLVMKLAHLADPADGYPPDGLKHASIRYADIWKARRALGLTAPPAPQREATP